MVVWNNVIYLILNMRDYTINVDFTEFSPTLSVLTLIHYLEDLTNRSLTILHYLFLWNREYVSCYDVVIDFTT